MVGPKRQSNQIILGSVNLKKDYLAVKILTINVGVLFTFGTYTFGNLRLSKKHGNPEAAILRGQE
jgi:hypothetical protein